MPPTTTTAAKGTYSSKLRDSSTIKQVVSRFQSYKPLIRQDDFFPDQVGESRAAVLVGLSVPTSYDDPNAELHVLLTVRSSKLNTFPSEVALPGGRADLGKDAGPVETAVREAEEEVGLDRSLIEVLVPQGWMSGHVSRNGLLVTPVVALIPPMKDLDLQLNPAEVDRVFFVPLSHFTTSTNHSTEKTQNSAARHRFTLPDQPPTFGLTAHILVHVAIEATGCRGDTMPEDERPVFKHYSTFGSEPCDSQRWQGVAAMNAKRKRKGVAFHEEDKKRQLRDWGRVMGDAGKQGEGEDKDKEKEKNGSRL